MVCEAKDRTESSRLMWESVRVMKPIGLFQDGIVTRFSRHPYIGMRELEKRVFLDTRYPVFPSNREGLKNRILWEREEFIRDIMWKDQHHDLILADGESMRWNLTL